MFPPPISMGTMAKGSRCSTCQKDISGKFGVSVLGKDLCAECAEKEYPFLRRDKK